MRKQINLFLLLFFVMSFSVNAILTDELVEYYAFEDDNGELGRYNLTSVGETVSLGLIDNCYNLTRNTGDNVTLNLRDDYLADSFTMNVWVNFNEVTPPAVIMDILYATVVGVGSTGLRYQDGFYLQGDTWWDGGTENEHVKDATFTHANTKNTWQMITLVRNSTNNNVKLYVNASYRGESVTNPTENKANANFSTMNTNDQRSFDGCIDETAFWNRTLSPSEITELYNGGTGLAYENYTLNFTVTAENIITKIAITSFSIIVSNGSTTYNLSTTTGEIATPILRNGAVPTLWNISITANGFAGDSLTNYNTTNNYEFNLYTTNSLNITFRRSDNQSIIDNTNITIQFVGGTTQTNITQTGLLYVDLLTPSSYTLIYDAEGFRQGSYIFTLVNGTHQGLTLFMDEENATSLVLITVRNKFSKDPLANAIVTVQRYFNDTWNTEQILSTDFNGQTEGYFVVSTEFYNFLVESDGIVYFGVVNSNENKKTIYAEDVSNGIIIEVDDDPNTVIPNYQATYEVITSLSFTNTSNSTGSFTFFWDNTNNEPIVGLLKVTVGLNQNCSISSTSESGSVTCPVNVTDNSDLTYFVARGHINGVVTNVRTELLGSDNVLTINWGATGWFISIFTVLIGFTMFLSVPSLSVLVGALVFGILIIANVILKNVSVGVVMLLMFLSWIIAKLPSNNGGEN